MGKMGERAAGRDRGPTKRGEMWMGHLERIEAEGIATKDYAAREGLSTQALYQAKKRLVAQGTWPKSAGRVAPRFARVAISSVTATPPPPASWALRLRLPSGAALEWSAMPGADLLGAVLDRVGAAR